MQRRMFMRLALTGAAGGLMAATAACAATNTEASMSAAAPAESMAEVDGKVTATKVPSKKPTAIPKVVKAVATAIPTAVPASASLLLNEPVAPVVQSDTWLNVKQPLVWDALRGQVVMVDFWTIGCINCQHVYPQLKQTYADYKDRGFTIVSVHAPEFDYERKLENVRAAIKREGIEYPVAIDNDYANWNRYRNRYWPAWYLVDKRGVIRFTHVGEGGDGETRQWIETLLAE